MTARPLPRLEPSNLHITRIEPIPRRPDRVRIHVDDRLTVDISRLVAEEFSLRPGYSLDEDEIARLRDRDQFETILNRALRFLENRPRSEREVRDRLFQKGTSSDQIDAVIDRLRAVGLIDDAAFAQFWIENRERFSPRGARALKAELRQKGLSTDLITTEVDDKIDEEASAKDAARRMAPRLTNLNRQTFRQKLWPLLARRGFDFDVIGPAIDDVWEEIHENTPECEE